MKTAKLSATVSCLQNLLCLLVLTLFASAGFAQVAVTNPGNTTPGLLATYPTLAAAITDLNAQTAISGPVVITLTGDETAPAGGYAITAIPAGASATNNIVIEGSASTIMAPAPQSGGGALTDAIFKLIGADFITIQNFTMQENPANVIIAAGTNDMTEWGVALLYASTTNGAQNNTIQNNAISLNRAYQNTFGIYSNSTHTATAVTTSATATTAAGGNSGVKVYGNTISNVNHGIVVVGPTAAADANTGINIGGTGGAQANTISNFGTTGTFSGYANVSTAAVNGILVRNSNGFNISFNSITSSSGASGVTAGTLRGIIVPAASNQPVGTFANTVNNNTLSLTSHVLAGIINGISVETTTGTPTSTTNINNNDFTTLNHTIAAATAAINAILQSGSTTAGPLNHSISNNTFTNLTSSSTGTFTFINNNWTRPTNGVGNINNNSIVTAFNRTGVSGTVTLYTSNSTSGPTINEINTGNNFSNITVTGTAVVNGWRSTDGGSPIKTVTGNTFANWSGGTGALTGLAVSFSGSANVSANTVSNISGAGAVVGIETSSGTSQTLSQNTVHTLTGTGTGAVTGMAVLSGTTQVVSKNKIYDLSNTNAGGATNGVLVSGGTTVTVANNLIGNLFAPAASGADVVRGISSTSTAASSTINLFYNTIYLNAASSGVNFGSSGVFHTTSTTATTATLNMRNNVIVNTSTPNGTGLTVAYRRSSGAAGALANYASTSNNNDFYAGTPGAANLIYADGTSTAQTIAAYKGGVFTAGTIAPRDSASFTELPPFLSTAGASSDFLHIDPSIATQLESAAAPIAGITDDFDGNTRNATTPDVGADEFNGILLDLTPPTITYTAIGNTNSLSDRTLTATITDASGVPTAGAGLPVLYWRINAGAYTGATAASLGGNQYQFTFGSGVATGDVVSYYVVAQDSAATPNVGSNPAAGAGGFTANPPAAATPPTTPNSYTILPGINGTFTVGAGGTYPTLTAAIADLNSKILRGPVVFELQDATYPSETFPIIINANGGSSATNTVTIKPAASVVATLSGSVSAGALIKFNGASFMTIDGSNSGGTDRSLTLANTSVTTPNVVWFGSVGTTPITDDVLKNCIVINGVNTSSAVVISDAATAGNAGFFSNITIHNNSVQRAFVGVFAQGGTTPQNGSNLVYTQNDLTTSGTNAIRTVGLYMQGVNGATVSQNTIGNLDPVTGENDAGIWLAAGTINATVADNTVSALNYTGTAGFSPVGINVTPGVAISNNVVTGNSISNMLSGGSSSTALVAGVSVTGVSGAVTIEKNDIQNIGNSNPATWPAVGINLNGGNNNIVRNNFVSRIFNDQTAGTGGFGPTFGVTGIRLNLGTGHQVYHNSVHLFGAMAGTVNSNMVICLAVSGTGVSGCDVRNNILSNEMTGGNPTGGNTRFVAIHLPSGATATMNLTLNNNAYYEGTHANCRMAVVGTAVGSGDFAAANFNPAATTPATNFRSYSSTLSAAGTNDNASFASTAAVPFVSATDLHLNASPIPGITGGGAAVSVTDDIDGDLRQSPPEIGADEIPDDDGDGVIDNIDNCPLVSNADQLDSDGDGDGNACDADDDDDGVLDGADNCPLVANAGQEDFDGDLQGDACDLDDDGDGDPDATDCADLNPAIGANAPEICDGIDNDCDGDTDDADSNLTGAPIWFADPDGDGIGSGAGMPACTQPPDTVAIGGDNCPTIANPAQTDTDSDGQGDACDADDDGDGAADGSDNCPLTSNADQADGDGDGVGNVCDDCPSDPDNDADGDGLCADVDNCPTVPNPDQLNTDGDGQGDACDLDDDNDGIGDVIDNCPLVVNADQVNTDGDGQGDACDTDDDGDGVPDIGDNCPLVPNTNQLNADGDLQGDACDPDDDNDTVLDGADNCPLVANTDQANADADGLGDACDACPLDPNNDIDGDGICGNIDNCPFAANPDQLDTDDDGVGDVCDTCPSDPLGDADGDGICSSVDNCPTVANPLQEDNDEDDVGNACDNCIFNPNPDQADCDEDGIGDACEGKDCNENGVPDSCDIADATSNDINSNGVPDDCECPANVNTDGTSANQVDVDDLIAVILAWGLCDEPCPPYCVEDINHDCAVDVDDLIAVILAWGPCDP